MTVLNIPIVKIGTSKGIRIPKKVLQECNMTDNVVATIDHGQITLKAQRRPREGWTDDAKLMHKNGDDKLLEFPELINDEWVWQ